MNNNLLSAFTVFGISLIGVCGLQAQDSTVTVAITPEVVISATKTAVAANLVPQQIKSISANEIALQNAATTADLLQNTGAAYIQKSQQGGGSVTLRGFEANKVLFVVDGVRMSNAIYRAGHLQNIITLDANMMESMEVLYGAGSTAYGSDAIGGVVSVFSKNPKLNNRGGNAFVRYGSVNQEVSAHVDFNVGGNKWASMTSVTGSRFDDLRKGANYDIFYKDYKNIDNCNKYVQRFDGKDSLLTNNDVNLQRGSGYSQYDFMQKILFQPNGNNKHLLNVQYSTSSNVPRYDRLQNFATTPKYSEWYYGPQNRMLATYRFEHTGDYKIADKIVVQPAYQIIGESRFTRRFKNDILNAQIEKVSVASLNIEAYKKFNDAQNLAYGAEVTHNTLVSVGENRNLATATVALAVSRYPNAQLLTAGLFASHRYNLTQNIALTGGLRYSFTRIDAQFNPLFYDEKLTKATQQNDALTWNLGATADLGNGFWVSALASTAFRAPNVDDMGKTFEQNNGTLQVPNATLCPEKVFHKELSLQKRFGNNNFANNSFVGLNVFHASLNDAIAVRPYTQNGSDSTTYNNVKYKMVASANVNAAETYGASFDAKIGFTRNWSTSLNATYTRGNDLTNNTRLDHVPPIFGNFAINFQNNLWNASVFSRFNTWKHLAEYKLAAEDNEAFATAAGTPAWVTANVRVSKKITLTNTQSLTAQLAVENILDSYYRTFASGIGAAGRNVSLTVRYGF